MVQIHASLSKSFNQKDYKTFIQFISYSAANVKKIKYYIIIYKKFRPKKI